MVAQEIRESAFTSVSEHRLIVAEFGLLDAQLANLKRLVAEMADTSEALGEGVGDGEAMAVAIRGAREDVDSIVLDEDELEVGPLWVLRVLHCWVCGVGSAVLSCGSVKTKPGTGVPIICPFDSPECA